LSHNIVAQKNEREKIKALSKMWLSV